MEVFYDDILDFEDNGGSDDCDAPKAASRNDQNSRKAAYTHPSAAITMGDVSQSGSSTGASDEDEYSVIESEHENDEILSLLEGVALDVVTQLTEALSSYETSQSRTGRAKINLKLANRRDIKPNGSFGTRVITYPRKANTSAKPLAQFMRVVDLIHEALSDGIPTTKRDMYYKDVSLFGTQSVVDRLVDDIAATMSVSRSDLNVRASAKGLFCGSALTLHLSSGDIVHGNDFEGALIPPSEDISRFEVDEQLSWILVVEKEAVFQTLCHLNFANHRQLPGPGIIITGKGYPDVATRQLVANLARNLPTRIPILALVDADPYGIDILSVYRYGSISLSHEEELSARRIRWAGVMVSELSSLGVEKNDLVPITKYDEKKALSMLKKQKLPRKWRRELQHMLLSRRKAEIETLSVGKTGPTSQGQLSQTLVSQDELMGKVSRHNTLLVRYLAKKITLVLQEVD